MTSAKNRGHLVQTVFIHTFFYYYAFTFICNDCINLHCNQGFGYSSASPCRKIIFIVKHFTTASFTCLLKNIFH